MPQGLCNRETVVSIIIYVPVITFTLMELMTSWDLQIMHGHHLHIEKVKWGFDLHTLTLDNLLLCR